MSLTFRVRVVLVSAAPPSSHANAMKPRVTDIKMQLKGGRDNTEFMSAVKKINFSSWPCMMLVAQSSLCSGWSCIVWNAAQCQSRAKMVTQPCALRFNHLYFKQQTNTYKWVGGMVSVQISCLDSYSEFYSAVNYLGVLQVISILFLCVRVCVCVCVCVCVHYKIMQSIVYILFIYNL